jgi:hypothetical protein
MMLKKNQFANNNLKDKQIRYIFIGGQVVKKSDINTFDFTGVGLSSICWRVT